MFWNTATRWAATKLNWVSTQFPPPPRAPDDTAPRKVLLVHAHPQSDSFSAALAAAAESGARDGGHEVRRRNLCQEKFQPVMTASDRGTYFDADKGAARLTADVRSHVADLRWCDSLIFVYPTWWFNMPAILKGYFDRTLAPGRDCTWDLPNGKEDTGSSGLIPRLTNVKRVMAISTYGASQKITLLAGDNGRNTIGTAIRPLFAPECTVRWLALYNMDFSSQQAREEFLTAVKSTVRDEF